MLVTVQESYLIFFLQIEYILLKDLKKFSVLCPFSLLSRNSFLVLVPVPVSASRGECLSPANIISITDGSLSAPVVVIMQSLRSMRMI
jgi:hypothetical protein